MDVLETESGVEIIVDLPGIDAEAVTITYRDGSVVIAGDKRPTRCQHKSKAAFHLAERGFGRFARAVRLRRRSRCGPRPGDPHRAASSTSSSRASTNGAVSEITIPVRTDASRRLRAARCEFCSSGDIFGKPGREIARRAIPALVSATASTS